MSEVEQMPLEIWTDINGNATRTQFKGGVKYIRADERDRLAELVRQAQPHVCSLLCPSVKARHELWTHTKLCLNMQAALTPAAPPLTTNEATETSSRRSTNA